MEREQLTSNYRKKKEQHDRESEKRDQEKEERDWLIEKIASLNIKKLRAFIQDSYKKYENGKLGVVAFKSIHKRLGELVRGESLYCYEDLKGLYQKYRGHQLTIEQYQRLMEGSRIKTEKDAHERFFQVQYKNNFGLQVTKPYYQLIVRAESNEIIRRIYVKKKIEVPAFNHKEHPHTYLGVFDQLDFEQQRYRSHRNGVQL